MSLRALIRPLRRDAFASAQTRCIHTSGRTIPRRTLISRQSCRPSPVQQRLLAHTRPAGTFVGNTKKLFKANPVSMTLALAMIAFGAGALLWVNRFYFSFMALHNYPDEVAKQLRKAIYYTSLELNLDKAARYYKEAILKAEECNMDPFSDEVIGIKTTVAGLMEKTQQYNKQTSALEIIRRDCLVQAEKLKGSPEAIKDRTRLLRWGANISVKLGELYSMPEVWDRDAAERHLSWAIEMMVRERLRRNTLRITDEQEGPWLSTEELAATIEGLASTYESKDQHYLAAPLFLHAINLHPVKSCHSVVLMNNLASSLSQQTPRAAAIAQELAESPVNGSRSTVPVTRDMLLSMAQTWAGNALDTAAEIAPPARTEECDIGCAVALHNLGEIAEMLRDVDEAKKRYREAISLARAVGFKGGLDASTERLKNLEVGE